jgi:hypothetical protein
MKLVGRQAILFPYKLKFWKANFSAYYLLQAGFLFDLSTVPEDGGDIPITTSIGTQQTTWPHIAEDRKLYNYLFAFIGRLDTGVLTTREWMLENSRDTQDRGSTGPNNCIITIIKWHKEGHTSPFIQKFICR